MLCLGQRKVPCPCHPAVLVRIAPQLPSALLPQILQHLDREGVKILAKLEGLKCLFACLTPQLVQECGREAHS